MTWLSGYLRVVTGSCDVSAMVAWGLVGLWVIFASNESLPRGSGQLVLFMAKEPKELHSPSRCAGSVRIRGRVQRFR